ncbi:MAG: hypothetical protein JW791_00375 [Nanoarchaeota archaeon]|nr:hypothetical protein [Nanoarchaeota archaeon]
MENKFFPFLLLIILACTALLSAFRDNNAWFEISIIAFLLGFYYFFIRKEFKEDILKLINKFEVIEKKFERIDKHFMSEEERFEKQCKIFEKNLKKIKK